ncbi:MAG: hypothetical protein HC945_02555, partial [Nitrosarchaeum sp.]|nr:hypothetical protein [Nitrosarchaeum sp.]
MNEWILQKQVKHPWAFLLAIALVIILFGYYALQLEVDPSFDALISSQGEFNSNQRALRNAFSQNDALILLVKADRESILSDRPRGVIGDHMGTYYQDVRTILAQSHYVETISEPQFSPDGRYARIFL